MSTNKESPMRQLTNPVTGWDRVGKASPGDNLSATTKN